MTQKASTKGRNGLQSVLNHRTTSHSSNHTEKTAGTSPQMNWHLFQFRFQFVVFR